MVLFHLCTWYNYYVQELVELLKHVKVPMPKKGCVIKVSGNSFYVYYATNYYRDNNGAPRTTRALIGKKDNETGNLIPNDKYFELFKIELIIKGGKND